MIYYSSQLIEIDQQLRMCLRVCVRMHWSSDFSWMLFRQSSRKQWRARRCDANARGDQSDERGDRGTSVARVARGHR